MHMCTVVASDKAAIELARVNIFDNTWPVVIKIASHAKTAQALELDQVNDHESKDANQQDKLTYLEVDEVLRHEFARANGRKESNNGHDTSLDCK